MTLILYIDLITEKGLERPHSWRQPLERGRIGTSAVRCTAVHSCGSLSLKKHGESHSSSATPSNRGNCSCSESLTEQWADNAPLFAASSTHARAASAVFLFFLSAASRHLLDRFFSSVVSSAHTYTAYSIHTLRHRACVVVVINSVNIVDISVLTVNTAVTTATVYLCIIDS